MKKLISLILAFILILALAACGADNGGSTPDAPAEIRDGFYLADREKSDIRPYLSVSTTGNSFQSGPGIMMDIAIGDKYEIVGDRLICHEGFGGDAVIEFRVISDTQLELTSFDPGEDGRFIAYWLSEGDVYHHVDLPSYDAPIEEQFSSVDTADDALVKAQSSGIVVIMNMSCASGFDKWQEFVESVDSGEPAEVLAAHYYTLDKERVSEELYEQEKDDYPQLFYYLLDYDGEQFTVTVRRSDEQEPERRETYKCLNHYEGEPNKEASFSHYDYYVLTDDPEVTWEEIEKGMYSSQAGDWIPHCTIFQNVY